MYSLPPTDEATVQEVGVYDMTFGYNLAQFNFDHRHPSAGYRYTEDIVERGTLHPNHAVLSAEPPTDDRLVPRVEWVNLQANDG